MEQSVHTVGATLTIVACVVMVAMILAALVGG
jgi:hypothetical protein